MSTPRIWKHGKLGEVPVEVFLKQCGGGFYDSGRSVSKHILQRPGWTDMNSPAQLAQEALFIQAADKYVGPMVAECRRIKAEEPSRASKATGAPGQVALREQVHAQFMHKIQRLAGKMGMTQGRFLFYQNSGYPAEERFRKIARSFATGDLAVLPQCLAVTCPSASSWGDTLSIINVVCEDAWDQASIAQVFRALLVDCGVTGKAFKADVLTILGITSKHETKIRTGLYDTSDFMSGVEMDACLAEYDLRQKSPEKSGFPSKTSVSASPSNLPVSAIPTSTVGFREAEQERTSEGSSRVKPEGGVERVPLPLFLPEEVDVKPLVEQNPEAGGEEVKPEVEKHVVKEGEMVNPFLVAQAEGTPVKRELVKREGEREETGEDDESPRKKLKDGLDALYLSSP